MLVAALTYLHQCVITQNRNGIFIFFSSLFRGFGWRESGERKKATETFLLTLIVRFFAIVRRQKQILHVRIYIFSVELSSVKCSKQTKIIESTSCFGICFTNDLHMHKYALALTHFTEEQSSNDVQTCSSLSVCMCARAHRRTSELCLTHNASCNQFVENMLTE